MSILSLNNKKTEGKRELPSIPRGPLPLSFPMEEDQAASRKSSSLDPSTRLEASSSSIASPAPLQRGGKGGREGEARGAQGGEVSPSPAPVATPPQYRIDVSIVNAAMDNNLPLVMSLHHEGISLDSVTVSTAITTQTVSMN